MDFHGLMTRRFACKRFRSDKVLSRSQVDALLEIGRLSPSSFGLEAWRFIAVLSPKVIAEIGVACGEQDAVRTASCIIVLLIPPLAAFSPDSEFIKARAERFPGGLDVFRDDYKDYYAFLRKEGRLEHWARAQTYIACANMMTGAAAIGLDSCAIEGFDESKVLGALGKLEQDWKVGILASFGYAAEECRPKIREALESICEIVD